MGPVAPVFAHRARQGATVVAPRKGTTQARRHTEPDEAADRLLGLPARRPTRSAAVPPGPSHAPVAAPGLSPP